MRVERTRANAITVVATSQELSALVCGARMALSLIATDPDAPMEARELGALLRRVLADYDEAVGHNRHGGIPCTSRSSPSTSPI